MQKCKNEISPIFRHDEATTTEAPPSPDDVAAKGPKYDEATQALVDAANAARSEFDAAERLYRDLEREVQDLEMKLETDYGPGVLWPKTCLPI
jgi:protein kinase C substrate 80K-H